MARQTIFATGERYDAIRRAEARGEISAQLAQLERRRQKASINGSQPTVTSKIMDYLFGWTISDRCYIGHGEVLAVECHKPARGGDLQYRWLEHWETAGGVLNDKPWQSFGEMGKCLGKSTALKVRQELARKRPEILQVRILKD